MTEVTPYPPKHHFEGSFHRPLAPASGFSALALSHPSRDMTYHNEGYYGAPPLSRQSLGTRSSSVSSTSSSTSYSVPYNTVTAAQVGASRTVSPTSGASDSGTSTVVYSRSQYPTLAHEQLAFRSTPFPSQFIQAQAASPLPSWPPFQTTRQIPRPPSYGGYAVDALHQQPPSFSYDTWHPMFAAPTPCHTSPAPPTYQVPPLTHRQSPSRNNDGNWFVSGMRSLPPDIIFRIQEYVTWYHCWKTTHISKWFLHNFHPDNFHHLVKTGEMVNIEKHNGREPSDEAMDLPHSKKPGKDFEFMGCYRCFRFKGFDHFEAHKHGPSVFRGGEDSEDENINPTSRREQSFTPPSSSRSPPANPHYDPSLTRSSLRASSTTGRGGRRAAGSPSASDPLANMHPRAKKTFQQRRFCVDCGLKDGIYEPGELIELHKPRQKGDAIWVCRCKKLHSRIREAQCHDCSSIAPLSVPR